MACPDIVSFAKNTQHIGFKIEYQKEDKSISDYFPDFLVKRSETEMWIVETKGREDLDDVRKFKRLQTWAQDANEAGGAIEYRAMRVPEEGFRQKRDRLKSFQNAVESFA